MDTIQISPNGQLVIERNTKRLILKSDQARRELLNKLHRLNVPATIGAVYVSRGEFVINLSWPNEPLQLEVMNPIIRQFPHEIVVDPPNS
jgi:hypothetical protein